MNKEIIVDIIKSSLREISMLAESLSYNNSINQNEKNVPAPFIDLMLSKYQSLGKEIELLRYWVDPSLSNSTSAQNTTPQVNEVVIPATSKVAEPEPEPEPVKLKVTVTEPSITEEPVKIEEDPRTVTTSNRIQTDAETTEQTATNTTVEETTAERVETKAEKTEAVKTAPQASQVEQPKITEPVKPAETATTIMGHTVIETRTGNGKPSGADIIKYGTPVSKIRQAMGLNDKLLYQRELFTGDFEKMDNILNQIDMAGSFTEAEQLLKQFGWNNDEPTVQNFINAVHRRFL